MDSDSKNVRKLSLTSELVALCHRDIADPGSEAKYDYFVDADYGMAVERWLPDEVAPAYDKMKADPKRGVSAKKVFVDVRAPRQASESKSVRAIEAAFPRNYLTISVLSYIRTDIPA